ncbi:MAG: TonB-dependent receptor [Rhodothermaceae bacterium]|nr:MAG: TonB-dependent receptor [Rhodothermaceae bacterium]
MYTRIGGLLCLLLCGVTARAQEASLNGFVKDAATEETLILANVVLVGTPYGAATNNAGYYTLPNLPPGTYTVVASYIGYETYRAEITLAPGEVRRLDIALLPDGVRFSEIEVTAERLDEEEVRRVGAARLKTDVIKQLPAVLEPDVFRSLQLLPGVKAASDYSSGLYIRGGSPDQTLILLDRTTVYNPTHFFGFFSTFNPDAIKDVRLYKGGYPAEYGGRLGSVVDIYNKDGNRRETRGSASLGLLASRALVEGPYRRGSWMLAVRRSTLEPLLAVLREQEVEGIPEAFYFIDVNGKLNFDAGPNDRLSLAFYAGQDALRLPFLDDARIRLLYGNRTASANWTHLFSPRLFSNFTFTASRYFSEPTFDIAGTPIERVNTVHDVSAKGDLEYVPNERHALEGGFWTGLLTFRLRNAFDGEVTLNERTRTLYGAFYLQETYRPSPAWTLQGGLRASYFGEGAYLRLEPRFSIEHRPVETVRLQAGYGRYYQFLTLITSQLFTGFDTWLTTGEGVPPAWGDQFVAGVKTRLSGGVNLDVELYYRNMEALFELDPFLPDPSGLDYADLFQFGDGFAYGAELFLEKPEGRLNGFLGYTYGVTRRRFPNLNGASFFPPKYDRTHELNVVLNFDLTRSWRLTGVFNYATGQAYTEPGAWYQLNSNVFGSQVRNVFVSEFNQARLPAYHRLDVGASKRGRFFGFADYELQLQLLNAYNRRNVWFYFFEVEDDTIEREEVPQIPVPLPNLSFTLRF